jgi:hypothetical protein
LVALPAIRRLISACEAAAGGKSDEGYAAALTRWRVAGVLLSVFYMLMLALMVLRPLVP